ncbi:sugar nucleotide-binding protein [Virgibacillus sp. W0181]|uniref:sugar nucleotide-binding protein n=1 Tax=Virgibacillus sp. W0181 TaxID=3391581 RepID=UPI003F47CBB8
MKVCIFGASGYVGESVYERLSENRSIQTVGTYLENEGQNKHDRLIKLDINDPESFSNFYKRENPDVVVWSVMAGVGEHQLTDQGLMHVITHLTPETKFIYISSDLVFAEGNGPYQVNDPISTFPDDHFLSEYANAKVKAERLIDNEISNYAILRTGPIYGKNRVGMWDSPTNDMVMRLKDNKVVSYRDDLIRTFTPVNDLTEKIVELVQNDQTGIFHIGEKKGKSFYEFKRELATKLGYDTDFIKKASEDEEPDHKHPQNISLKITEE